MATIIPKLRKYKGSYIVNENGESLIYVMYGHKGKTFLISTETKVKPKYWQGGTNTEQPLKKHNGYTSKVEFINVVRRRLDKAIKKTIVEDIEPTVEIIREIYKKEVDGIKKVEYPFFTYFEKYLEEVKTTKSSSTIKQYKACKNNLQEYVTKKKIKISFDSINITFYDSYVKYLLEKKGMNNNTVGNQIKNLKTFLNYAVKRGGIELKTSLSDFKVFKEKPTIIYLTQTELLTLQDYDFSKNKRLEKVRDLFLLGCKTGLRISDLTRLGKQHINDGWISLKAHKNKNKIDIPITNAIAEILEKYDYKMPIISEQKYNAYIKEACKKAGIDSNIEKVEYKGGNKTYIEVPKHSAISSHTAVKTFITHCGEKGISAKVVSQITGKSVRVILDHYYGTDKTTIKSEMERAFN